MRLGPSPKHRGRAVLAGIGGLLLTAFLVYASLASPIFIVLTLLVAGGALALSLLGAETVGFILLCVGFLFAAFSKGRVGWVAGPSVTVTDVTLLIGLVLLIPRMLPGRTRVSTMYTVGMILLMTTGLISSVLIDPLPTASMTTLIGMFWCMAVFPIGIAALKPTGRQVEILAWSFIAGHMISVADALVTAPASTRELGLTNHPNEYAESGLIALALCGYLLSRTKNRYPVYFVMAVSLGSIYLSGSRGGLVALAVLIVSVPFIERTALGGTLFTAIVGLGAAFLPIATEHSNQDSALGRLLGQGGSGVSGSDTARNEGLSYGLHQFFARPFSGSGLSNIFAIHINVLEVAVGFGIFGLAGFVLVVASLLWPAFSTSEHRRLVYVAVAFVVFGVTAPALTDRSMWLALSLGFVYFRGFRDEVSTLAGATSAASEEDELVVHADHLPQLR